MLSAEELTELRAMQEASMVDAVTITRKTLTASGAGYTTASSTRTTKGRVVMPRLSPQEKEIAGQETGKQVYVVVLPAGTDVRKADELTVVDGNSGETSRYSVIGIHRRSLETARRALCVEKI